MRDRSRIDVHAGDASGDTGENRGSITLARRNVQNVEPLAQVAGQTIAVEVLELDLPVDRSGHALAGELQALSRDCDPEISVCDVRFCHYSSRCLNGTGRRRLYCWTPACS